MNIIIDFTGDFVSYLNRLIAHYLPDGIAIDKVDKNNFDMAMDRIYYSFSHIRRKYYQDENKILFNYLNGDHMAVLLYFLSNSIYERIENERLATKIFYLNKILHGIDLFYSIPMPNIFILVHPVGTVIGRGSFNDYLVVYQNCTIGSEKNEYPTLGEGVVMYSGSSIIGKSRIGDNVIMGANSFVIDAVIPNDSVCLGNYPSNRIIRNNRSVKEQIFGITV